MEISKNCPLIISNLFSYDFSACAYNLLKSIGWDLSNIEFDNKEKRNIQIGLLQRDNEKLAKFLTSSINNLVDYYFKINNIKTENLIVRAKDGFIINKKMAILDHTMPIDLRSLISKIIISSDRKKYLAIHVNGNIEVKGIRNKPVDVSFYKLFRNLSFSTNRNLLSGIENIRQAILNSENILWFTTIDDNNYIVPILGSGMLKLNRSSLQLIDPEEIDKTFLWDEYIWPFARSILIHCSS
jgi:hypothetical protein